MDHNLDNKIEFKDKLFSLLKENKLKLFFLISIIFLVISIVIFIKFNNEKKNELISEKYIQAGLYLASKDEKKSKDLYEEVILSNNKFYSILALNTILEKDLEKEEKKIMKYFANVESLVKDIDVKNLIQFKKALYLIKNSNKIEGTKLLNNIIKTESKLKSLAEEVLAK